MRNAIKSTQSNQQRSRSQKNIHGISDVDRASAMHSCDFVYEVQYRNTITVTSSTGAVSVFKQCGLNEVLALVRNRCRSTGQHYEVLDSEGYCEHIKPTLAQQVRSAVREH